MDYEEEAEPDFSTVSERLEEHRIGEGGRSTRAAIDPRQPFADGSKRPLADSHLDSLSGPTQSWISHSRGACALAVTIFSPAAPLVRIRSPWIRCHMNEFPAVKLPKLASVFLLILRLCACGPYPADSAKFKELVSS